MSFSLPPSADLLPPPLSVFTPEATSKSTNILVQSIYASNLSFIHSLLFSPAVYPSSSPALYPIEVPILVNLPDSKGWSLIHHCVAVERPSIEILDALYCAGADVSLVTTHEEQTALHIIARLAKSNPNFSSDLQQFVLHLVNDLRTPLAAQDKDDETCIHFAAEHGDSLELLQLLLACDINGTVREMKNSRGLTPVEVSKPAFLSAFGVEEERSPSALSHYTIRPRSHSTVSLASIYVSGPSSPTSHEQFVLPSNVTTSMLIGSSTGFDPIETTHKLIANLDTTSPSLSHSISREHIDYLEKCVDQTQDHCDALVIHFRSQIEDAARAVRNLRKDLDKIRSLRNAFSLATRTKLAVRGLEAIPSTRRVVGSDLECQQRGSEDSQVTVSSSSSDGDSRGSSSTMNSSPASASGFSTKVPPHPTDHVSASMQASDQYVAGGFVAPNTDSTWMDRFIRSPESGVCWTNREEVEPELTILKQQQRPLSPIGNGSLHTTTTTRGSMRLKQVMKKMKKLEEKIQELEAVHYGSTTTSTTGNRKKNKDSSLGTRSRVKAWLKKMVVTSQGGSAASSKSSPGLSSNSKLEIVLDVDEADEGAAGREIKQTGTNTGSTVVAKLSLPTTTATAGPSMSGPAFQEYDILDRCVDNALRTSEMVLEHACGDMKRILQCLDAADKFLESANSSIMKTQRIVKRAVKQRELMLIDLHAAAAEAEAASKGKSSQQDPPLSPGLLGYSTALTSRPSLASISTIYSTASSTSAISLAATLTASERHRQPQDEQVGADSRTIRRLLLRRIEAQISGAWGEVDKVSGSGWVQVVKESVRGVKRRAYL